MVGIQPAVECLLRRIGQITDREQYKLIGASNLEISEPFARIFGKPDLYRAVEAALDGVDHATPPRSNAAISSTDSLTANSRKLWSRP